jgi:hypothetical protein
MSPMGVELISFSLNMRHANYRVQMVKLTVIRLSVSTA